MTCKWFMTWSTALLAGAGFAWAADETQRSSNADKSKDHAEFVVRPLKNLTPGDVWDKNGEKVGSIRNLAIDVNRGRIAYGVLSFGGALGVGDKEFAVPWSAIHKNVDPKDYDKISYSMNVDEQRLENARGFDKDQWPNMADMTWARDIHNTWDAEPYWEQREHGVGVSVRAGKEGVDVEVNRGQRPRLEGQPTARDQNIMIVRANDLVGHKLQDRNGEEFGDLENVMVDPESGRLVYGIIQVDKWPDFSKDFLYAVPAQLIEARAAKDADARDDAGAQDDTGADDAARDDANARQRAAHEGDVFMDADQFVLVTNVSKESLQRGPKFAEREWPNMTPDWGERVYSAYGIEPFWKDRTERGDSSTE